MKVGDTPEVKVTFPKEYNAEHLAGKDAIFSCKIKEVKEAVDAEINDDLAKKFGSDDLKGLKLQIAERLEAEYAGASKTVMKRSCSINWTKWSHLICLPLLWMQKRVK